MQTYQDLCDGILELDGSIRYAALADHLGSLLSATYREGLVPLSTHDETIKYTERAIHHVGALGGYQTKVGKLQYVVGKYENLIRATIPIVSSKFDKYYLTISFDIDSNPTSVIEEKILPYVKEAKFSTDG